MAGNDSPDHGAGLDILKNGHRWTIECLRLIGLIDQCIALLSQ